MRAGLAAALEGLAKVLPERVRWAPEADVWEIWADYGPHQGMTYTRHSIHPDEVVPPLTLAALRLTLEQECAARGWNIDMDIRAEQRPNAQCAILYTPWFRSAHGDTPTHALCFALLAALAPADAGPGAGA